MIDDPIEEAGRELIELIIANNQEIGWLERAIKIREFRAGREYVPLAEVLENWA